MTLKAKVASHGYGGSITIDAGLLDPADTELSINYTCSYVLNENQVSGGYKTIDKQDYQGTVTISKGSQSGSDVIYVPMGLSLKSLATVITKLTATVSPSSTDKYLYPVSYEIINNDGSSSSGGNSAVVP